MNIKELIKSGATFKQLFALGFSIKEIADADGPEPTEEEKTEAEKTEAEDKKNEGNETTEEATEKAVSLAVEKVLKRFDKADRAKLAPSVTNHGTIKTLQTTKFSHFGREVNANIVKGVADFWRAYKNRDQAEMLKVSKTLSEGTDADGGYFVHPEFEGEIFNLIEQYGVGRKLCRVLPMNSDTKNISSITAKPTAEMVGEGAATSGSTKPTIGQIQLLAKKAMANIIGTSELIEDNGTDIAIWDLMAELLAEAFAKLEDEQIFNGSGTGNNHTGILVSANTDINVVTMASGDTAFTDITADYLLDLQTAVPTSVRKAGVYVLNPGILDLVRKLKDDNGQYIWQGPANGQPGTIWGKPYEESDVLPDQGDSAVSTKFVIFGDLKKGAVLGQRTGLTFKQLTEGTVNSVSLADTDQEALRGRLRFAFSVALGDAIAILKTAAS